ncbi:hypothetical protein [Zavarzinella formosa]|uniref:hypothetical protein n=1 Tax=Zavarzinella formosa TaxID=360055 RepID=UPI0002DFDBEE|nr:hypothetical protein [Zavarzinella formosa]
MRHRLACVAVGMCCVLLGGCYQRAVEQDGIVYSFQSWGPALLIVAGLAAIPAGLVLFRKEKRFWGVLTMIVGPLLAGAVAPGMFMDRVIVNDDGFQSTHGFWWDKIVHNVRYDDLRQVVVVVEEKTTRRGKSYSYYFDCSFKNAPQERIPLGDLMKQALPDIRDQFEKHDVPVQLPANLPANLPD